MDAENVKEELIALGMDPELVCPVLHIIGREVAKELKQYESNKEGDSK